MDATLVLTESENIATILIINGRKTRTARSTVNFSVLCAGLCFPLFNTHKLTSKSFLSVDIKDMPVRLLQSAGKISTSSIITVLDFILKRINENLQKQRIHFVRVATSTLETCSTGKPPV